MGRFVFLMISSSTIVLVFFFCPFTKIMLKEMVSQPTREESKKKENRCSNTFTNKCIDVQIVVSQELINKVSKVEKDVHKISHRVGNQLIIF